MDCGELWRLWWIVRVVSTVDCAKCGCAYLRALILFHSPAFTVCCPSVRIISSILASSFVLAVSALGFIKFLTETSSNVCGPGSIRSLAGGGCCLKSFVSCVDFVSPLSLMMLRCSIPALWMTRCAGVHTPRIITHEIRPNLA